MTLFTIFLSFCIFMQNWSENAPVSTFLLSFTKHVCKPTSSLEDYRHGTYEA